MSRPTAVKALKLMMEHEPHVAYDRSDVQHFLYDQKYMKKGASRAKHTGQERVDASGDLVEVRLDPG